MAAVGAGVHPDLGSAVSAMVSPAPIVRPRPEVTEQYTGVYSRVFRSGLGELLGLARELDRLRR